MNKKEEIASNISEFLLKQSDILFFVFFGSFARNGYDEFRDIDVAVYMTEQPELMRLGFIISELEFISDYKVDVIVLNDLYKSDPVMSQEIVGDHEMIPNHNIRDVEEIKEIFAEYCVRSVNAYEDTKQLRDLMDSAFRRRIKEGAFAKFNHD